MSQNEIDNLLSALSSGELDIGDIKEEKEERKIKEYNFKMPNKFAKDHMRTLQIMHENFSRLLQTYLSGYLRTLVQLDVASVDQLTYGEFSNSMPNPSILGIVEFTPLSGNVIVHILPNIAFTMIERVLGGSGQGFERARGFTEIELSLIERIVNQLVTFFKDPWKNVIDLKPRIKKIETNPQFAQIMSPNETVALITLNIKIGTTEGMIHICIPHLVIEPVISKLSTKFWFSGVTKELTEAELKVIERRINCTFIPIRAVLGTNEITVKDFLELQIGDVIPLSTNVDSYLPVYIGNSIKFRGKPGLKKNKVAIKITDVLKKGDESNE